MSQVQWMQGLSKHRFFTREDAGFCGLNLDICCVWQGSSQQHHKSTVTGKILCGFTSCKDWWGWHRPLTQKQRRIAQWDSTSVIEQPLPGYPSLRREQPLQYTSRCAPQPDMLSVPITNLSMGCTPQIKHQLGNTIDHPIATIISWVFSAQIRILSTERSNSRNHSLWQDWLILMNHLHISSSCHMSLSSCILS